MGIERPAQAQRRRLKVLCFFLSRKKFFLFFFEKKNQKTFAFLRRLRLAWPFITSASTEVGRWRW
jgi:hypothetical protein